jgi:glycosyltransferase involved in cell wall biosynthesis
MKLLFLTQYFPPEMGAPQARIFELAIRLKKLGHEISILTSLPNYPTGKIFPEYVNKKKIKENFQELEVLRCYIFPTKSTNFIKRIFSYFSFVLSSMYYGPKYFEDQDFVIVESPPLFLGIAGIYLSKKFKAKMIFNVSDLWPDSAIELGVVKSLIFINIAKKLESHCYQKSIAITGQSPTIVEIVKTRIALKPVELITNGVDLKKFNAKFYDPAIKEKYGLSNKIVFVYAGLFGIAQGLDQIIKAAILTRDLNNIGFLLIGDGPEKDKLIGYVNKESLQNVRIVSPVSKDEMPLILASMDVALITLKVSLKGAVPSKIYEAMASGLPILFVGDGDGVKIIRDNDAGRIVEPSDIVKLVSEIKDLASNIELRKSLGLNGIYGASLFSRDNIAIKFHNIIKSL